MGLGRRKYALFLVWWVFSLHWTYLHLFEPVVSDLLCLWSSLLILSNTDDETACCVYLLIAFQT